MLVLITFGTPVTGILQLQEVGLIKHNTCCRQCAGGLLLEGLTNHKVNMVETNGAIIGQRILNQGIGVLAMGLGQTLVLLGQVHTVTLYPGRNPGLVVTRCRAIRKVDLIGQIVVLACNTNHLQQVNIGRGCTQETVYNRVTGQHLVNQQGVHGRDVAMDRVIIHTIAIGIVTITAGTAHLVVEYPGRTVVGLDGRLHIQHTAKHVTQVTVKALNILIGIRHSEVVLIGVRIHKTGTELNELNVHGIVHTGRITLKIRTGTLKGSLLVIVVKTDIIGVVHTATTEIHTVVLTDTRLKGFTEPVGIGIVLEMVESV